MFPPFVWALAAAGIGYGLYQGSKLVNFANNLQVNITKFGFPSIRSGRLFFPLQLDIDNPSTSTLKITSIFATVSRFDGQNWAIIGNTQPDLVDLQIYPQKRTIIKPELSLPLTAAPSAITSFFQQDTGRTFKVDIRIDISGNILTQSKVIQL